MAVPFATIKPEVDRLRNFIIGDLDCLISQEAGGNYLAAALITCACDTLSHLKYGKRNKGELFFAEIIPAGWSALAPVLYQAIRDGIVHVYDTKVIRINSHDIEVTISWRMKPHFHLSVNKKHIFVNVQNLASDLKDAIKRFETDLKAKPHLREVFERSMRRSRQISVENNERKIWEQCLLKMKVAT